MTPDQIIAVAGVIVGLITALITGIPWLQERQKTQFLNNKLGMGPYDKEIVERAIKYYVRPKCTNIDPSQEIELRHALVATREDLFDKIDDFIAFSENRRHLFILADSGTGKTSLAVNYFAYYFKSRKKHKGTKVSIVYLGFRGVEDQIRKIQNPENTVIFLDALDEDVKAIENYNSRILELLDLCRYFRRVIITCRTQFFPKDDEIPVETGIVRLGPKRAGQKGVFEFWKLYISPFDDADIKSYLAKRYSFLERQKRNRAYEITKQISELSVRPMLLAYIPDIIEMKSPPRGLYDLYELMIEAWLDRETAWVNKNELRDFSERLAVNIYNKKKERGMERIPLGDLLECAQIWNINLQPWQVSTRSLLNRDAQGNYKFAHRSIMEHLYIVRLLKGDKSTFNVLLTDQMRIVLYDILHQITPEASLIKNALLKCDVEVEGEGWGKTHNSTEIYERMVGTYGITHKELELLIEIFDTIEWQLPKELEGKHGRLYENYVEKERNSNVAVRLILKDDKVHFQVEAPLHTVRGEFETGLNDDFPITILKLFFQIEDRDMPRFTPLVNRISLLETFRLIYFNHVSLYELALSPMGEHLILRLNPPLL